MGPTQDPTRRGGKGHEALTSQLQPQLWPLWLLAWGWARAPAKHSPRVGGGGGLGFPSRDCGPQPGSLPALGPRPLGCQQGHHRECPQGLPKGRPWQPPGRQVGGEGGRAWWPGTGAEPLGAARTGNTLGLENLATPHLQMIFEVEPYFGKGQKQTTNQV